MKSKQTGLTSFFRVLAVGAVLSGVLLGCSDDSKPDMADAKERVKKMQSFVDIYKAVNGDWEKLTPEQKANLIDLQGGPTVKGAEVKARAGFIGASQGPMAAQKYLSEARARGEL